MKKTRIVPAMLAAALTAALHAPAAAELKTQVVDYKHGETGLKDISPTTMPSAQSGPASCCCTGATA